ncbi:MAG: tryptophan synthase subunit alpha [Candidatus Margulisbacteria bacterium]|nr:tryptophan synthase subunit alpha [Candidatus Margulisiibacteriota bacterium]
MNNDVIPYILAGYPDLNTTIQLLKFCQETGIRYIELGIPFSDPSADGPVIQEAAEKASHTFAMQDLYEALKLNENRFPDLQITVMTYANPLYAYGLKKFIKNFSELKIVRGLLIPDLPFNESGFIKPYLNKNSKIKSVWMISENLDDSTLKAIVNSADYYLYLMSYLGTTGNSISDMSRLKTTIKKVRSIKKIPIAMGFGIRNKKDVEAALEIADGAIVGTSIIKSLKDGISKTELFIQSLIP